MAGRDQERRRSVHIRTLFGNTGEGFIVLDDAGNIRIFNETAETLFDVPRASVIGKSVESLGIDKLQESLDDAVAKGRGRKPVVVQTSGRTLSCKPCPFESAEGHGVAIVVRDDTELLAQQERAEAILAGASDGLVVFDPDSRVTYLNPAAADMVGVKPKKVTGKHITLNELLGLEVPESEDARPCWEILGCSRFECPAYGSDDFRCWLKCGTPGPHGGSPQTYRDKHEHCLRCEVYAQNAELLGEVGAEAREVTILEPERRILQLRTNPVVSRAGRYLGCVTSLHDVTAEREIAVMKNEFVSMVSHELRTPLTSIKGYVDLVVDGDAGEINEVQKEFLQIVQENSNRLVSLINDLLDISRIESGRVHLKIEPVAIPEVIQGVIDTFKTMADQANVSLSMHVTRALPRVAGDRDRLGQVLMNLVSNAIKYSPGGGSVTVKASRRKDEVLVEITDTGIGISEEDQQQLFSKFFRVDSTLTREIGGTGLGLSICKSVIELLGGTIGVKSTAGEGSTFYFTLPIAPSELIRTPKIEGPAQTGGIVLVVDRNPEVAELIGTLLSKRGYEPIFAHNARDAFEAAVTQKPRVITLDVILEDMDGFDLLTNLKEDNRTSSIPIVVLSIVCDEGKSLRLGAADYLEKPIDQSKLVRSIDSLVGAMTSPVVLVVDDDPSIVSSLCHTLRARGFAAASAYNGAEAMAAIERKQPDLILLDLRMPVMDGYQVIQEVKSRPETNHIPIVVMTAHRIDHEKMDLLHMAAEQITKPLSVDSLADHVESLLTEDL